jgi:pimeloyl-ACP methyl ester carboxylesterase
MKRQLLCVAVCFLQIHLFAQKWAELGKDTTPLNANGDIQAITSFSSKKIYAAGSFTNSASKYYVAKWNDTLWSELGSLNANSRINCLTTDTSGNVYAAGFFTNAAGKYYVAKWNGITWTELGISPITFPIYSIITDKWNNVYAAGGNNNSGDYILKWNGTNWSILGLGTSYLRTGSSISSVVTDTFGNIFVGGFFTNSFTNQPYVAKYDSINWSEVGGLGGLNANTNKWINALATDRTGNIYATGSFTNSYSYPYVKKWNGSTWAELGTGSNALLANNRMYALATDLAGNVYAGGLMTNSSGKQYVAKWNGTKWAELGIDTAALNANGSIYSITTDETGNVYVAGNFKNSNNKWYVARFQYPDRVSIYNTRNKDTTLLAVYPLSNSNQNILSAKIATDEMESTLLRIKTDGYLESVKLRLNYQDSPPTDVYKSGQLTLRKRGQKELEYVYKHPGFYDSAIPLDKYIYFDLYDTVKHITIQTFILQKTLPPVLLLHGIWSNGTAMKNIKQSLITSQLYAKSQIANPDYPNNVHFVDNVKNIRAEVKSLLKKAVEEKVSAGKVDVVAHSMGGILTRLYYQNSLYENEKNIRKLITLNTPHSGSPVANLVMSSGFAPLINSIGTWRIGASMGALEDLQVNSSVIRQTLNGATISNGTVYNHAIFTDKNLQIGQIDINPNFFLGFYSNPYGKVVLKIYRHLCGYRPINNCFKSKIFSGEDNDLIVPISSQKGGISSTSRTYFSDISHISVEHESIVISKVLELLKADAKGSSFVINGFNPPILNPPSIIPTQNPRVESKNLSTLKIDWPSASTIKYSQDTVQIKVTASTDIEGMIVTCMNSDSLWVDEVANYQHTFSYTIPKNAIGKLKIAVLGFDSTGYKIQDTVVINVALPNTITLDSISVADSKIYLYKNLSSILNVYGHYSDNSVRNITEMAELVIASDSSRFTRASATLTGNVVGADTATLTFTGRTKRVPISVDTLTIEVVSSVLPLELISFKAWNNQHNNVLEWVTLSEMDTKGFEIQRSRDGQNWEILGWAVAKGNKYNINNYNFVDNAPFNLSYYRLNQIDLDGTSTFSKIISVSRETNEEVVVFPNPTTGKLSILAANVPSYIRIVNNLGQLLVEKTVDNFEIDISNLPAGVYYMELLIESKRTYKKIVKN